MHGATVEEIKIMQHMLGSSHPRQDLGWRNHGVYGDDNMKLDNMTRKGLVKRGSKIADGLRYYYVTKPWVEVLTK